MLRALEEVGLLAASTLTLNLVIGSVAYAIWVLRRTSPRTVRAHRQPR